MRDLGKMNGRFLRNDAALSARGLAVVAFDRVEARNQCRPLLTNDLQYFTLFSLISARGDNHIVSLFDFRGHHKTSGASEMIFMWFLARSSRVTGPKMRVPIGSPCGLIRTAALVSK